MAEHPNAEVLRAGYVAFASGDLESLREKYFDPNIVWHTAGHNHLAGDFSGVDAVMESFGRLMQESDGTFKTEVHDVLANDEHAVALCTFSASHGGKSITDHYAHVTHIRNGKMTESWIFGENQDEVDAFWG
jgi:uncharacterized protein